MMELKRISDEEIDELYGKADITAITWMDWQRKVACAQLEADQEKVKAIFEEIEERLFTFNGDGNLILTSAPPRDRIVIWWQALKQKYLKEAKR